MLFLEIKKKVLNFVNGFEFLDFGFVLFYMWVLIEGFEGKFLGVVMIFLEEV